MKLAPTRIPKLLALANGRACVNCLTSDGTVVAAHYQGFRSYSYGKGRGIKPHDAMAAHLCCRCHQQADSSGLADTREAHSHNFLLLILTTQLELVTEGQVITGESARPVVMELLGNASALMEYSEQELHETACQLGQYWDAGEMNVAPRGAMVSGFTAWRCA
ncbi:hypothetical protein [Microbulbifer sp. PSTR4-B]|uniref:hypothetical protein n=1 Tax=unclassified Microbulbifer TaxID=2619833 RepID=UPI00403AD75F